MRPPKISASQYPRITPKARTYLLELCAGRCVYCDRRLSAADRWHVDHVRPAANGGEHRLSNLVASCASCNAVTLVVLQGTAHWRRPLLRAMLSANGRVGRRRDGFEEIRVQLGRALLEARVRHGTTFWERRRFVWAYEAIRFAPLRRDPSAPAVESRIMHLSARRRGVP